MILTWEVRKKASPAIITVIIVMMMKKEYELFRSSVSIKVEGEETGGTKAS